MATTDTLVLTTPTTFPEFPYDAPYSIQLDLMRHVYSSIESSKIAIVESPTGTGKTLSLLTSSMKWLRDDKERALRGEMDTYADLLKADHEPEWLLLQSLDRHRRELEAEEAEFEERLVKARKREEELRRKEKGRANKKAKLSHQSPDDEADDFFLPEDNIQDSEEDNISPAVKELMKQLEERSKRAVPTQEADPICRKVYYASRTHSQLSQALAELRKLGSASHTRAVALGSRKNLCINDDIRKKGADIDEACRDLMNGKKGHKCAYLPPPDEETRMLDFRDHVLANPKDIEDLVALGQELNTCPYYGSRRAINQAELVTLPYNLLLQGSAREALGIDLEGQIVVIDEAHNLIDTILSIHSTTLTTRILHTSLSQLNIYITKFRKKFSPKHALHLKRLHLCVTALDKFCNDWVQGQDGVKASSETMMKVADLVAGLGSKADNVNVLEVVKYLKESKIARKISGYSDKLAERQWAKDPTRTQYSGRSAATPPLHAVETFLTILTNANEDGRILITRGTETNSRPDDIPIVYLKYQLLNPSRHFREVVEQSRAIILAGGTMSPMSDFRTQLFPGLVESRLSLFSCGHIVPPSHLQALIIPRGPRNFLLEFKFQNRGNKDLVVELGQIIMNLVNIVPDGMVAFFPSYSFLAEVRSVWEASGLLAKLGLKKKIFFEPHETADVENVLRDFASAIQDKTVTSESAKGGAFLLAVVGAKLSEGLNFSDNLARAVVLVGLPFANLGSTELKERMKYVTELERKLGAQRTGLKDAGTELYENQCLKAVNQSIGRAIRHRQDWASLILIDNRYTSPRIQAKLPQWIASSVKVTETFGQAVKELGAFYRSKRIAT